MARNPEELCHWADQQAERIIKQKGDLDLYTCASGITPSGTVHIGNFREIITVDLIVRALRDRGKNVRFIYSWDDYDVFRKVPGNMPKPEVLQNYLRYPITMVPDSVMKIMHGIMKRILKCSCLVLVFILSFCIRQAAIVQTVMQKA